MKLKTFDQKKKTISKHYRAVCYSKKKHWKGTWKASYTEAFDDGDKHRYTGNNSFHDIRIESRVYAEAKLK